MQDIFDIKKNDKNYYSILHCVESSTDEQIKAEYKRLALLHHPDKNQSAEDSQYPLIKEAFDVVGNPQNRAKYDRWRQSGLCIPFEDYVQLSGHAQTIHWQALPTQLTLTEQNQAKDSQLQNQQHLTSTLPQPRDQLPRVQINNGSFWSNGNKGNYAKFRNYEL